MVSKYSRTLAFAFLFFMLSAITGKLSAQSCPPSNSNCVVTGGDPEPIGHIVMGGVADDEPVVTGGDPEPIGHIVMVGVADDDPVVTGGDPEPIGHLVGDDDDSYLVFVLMMSYYGVE